MEYLCAKRGFCILFATYLVNNRSKGGGVEGGELEVGSSLKISPTEERSIFASIVTQKRILIDMT